MLDLDDEDHLFIARWRRFVRILLVESSVRHIAFVAGEHANFNDGGSCRPGNGLLVRETGYSLRTVKSAWAVMRSLGMATRSSWGSSWKGEADDYDLQIPGSWRSMPILGPHGGRFTCQHCGSLFDPVGNCTVRPDGSIGYYPDRWVFCPTRRVKGRDAVSCRQLWDRQRRAAGSPTWSESALEDVWKLFRLARNDDW